jgi:peroxiredoxin
VLIGKNEKIKKVWNSVKLKGNAEKVLRELMVID